MFKVFIISTSLFLARSVRADIDSTITRYNSQLEADGSYAYDVAQSNGAEIKEFGVGGKYATGSYQYYSPEGELVQVSYTADEHGFHPQSDSLPTPPPIPEYILKSLEYNRNHPEEEEQHEQLEQHQHYDQPQQHDLPQQHSQLQQHDQYQQHGQFQQHDQVQQHAQLQNHDEFQQHDQVQKHPELQQHDQFQQHSQLQQHAQLQQHEQFQQHAQLQQHGQLLHTHQF